MKEYRLKYYVFKASIKEQKIIIKNALKIWMFNNLGLVFKIYLTIINNQIQKNKKLEENEVLFKAIEEEETCIKTKHKASANFTSTKSNAKPKERTSKEKKEFIKQPKYKKYGCKYLANQIYKQVNDKYDKCHKKKHIAHFYNSYTFLNKGKALEGPAVSNLDCKKNINCVI